MIVGHQKIWQYLKHSAEIGKLSHAYLFSGQEKLGKRTLAIEFVKWLFNSDILKRQHPDFIFIEPIGKEIQISQIRECILRLSLKPSIAPYKVAIIDQAHLMNKEAQNCFLKTLEEPKGKTILILITEYPEMLFPTILSRVQKIKFYPLPSTEIENYLKTKGVSDSKIKEISRLSQGKPGRAIDFISNSKKIEERKQKITELIKILNSPLAFRFQLAKDLSREKNLREILDIWLDYFRNLLLERCLTYLRPGVKSDYSFSKLKNILKQIQRTNFLISTTNINKELALEILMLEL